MRRVKFCVRYVKALGVLRASPAASKEQNFISGGQYAPLDGISSAIWPQWTTLIICGDSHHTELPREGMKKILDTRTSQRDVLHVMLQEPVPDVDSLTKHKTRLRMEQFHNACTRNCSGRGRKNVGCLGGALTSPTGPITNFGITSLAHFQMMKQRDSIAPKVVRKSREGCN